MNALLGRFLILDLALFSAALIEVGWRGGFSTHKIYTCILALLASAHYWFFPFKKWIFQHLFLLGKYWGLWYILEGSTSTIVCPTFFGLGSEDFRELVYAFCERCPWVSVLILSEFSSLVSESSRSFNHAVLAVVSFNFLFLFPCFKGAPKFLEGLLCACEQCPGKYSPWIIVS